LLAYDCEDYPDASRLPQRLDSCGESAVLREEQVVARGDLSIESAVLHALQAEGPDGVNDVSEAPERFDETLREVLIEKNPHEAASSFD
jgi:hypothetical protein